MTKEPTEEHEPTAVDVIKWLIEETENPDNLTFEDYEMDLMSHGFDAVEPEDLPALLEAAYKALEIEAQAAAGIAEYLRRLGPGATLAKVAEGTRLVVDDTEDGESDQ